jgi:hypothetical protein
VEADKVTNAAWREDDFEERGIDPRMFASGGANTLIIEKESCWYPRGADLVFIALSGRIAEATVAPKTKGTYIVTGLPLWGHHWPGRDKLISPKWHSGHPPILQTPIVLSRLSIDEPSRQAEANSTVSSSVDYEQENVAAIHPVTKSVYDQLTSVPEMHGQAIEVLLTQFAAYVPKNNSSGLPPLRLSALEDSSYLLEWTFKDRRLGFSFEPDPKDSGWYYVYSKGSSELYESGTMDQLEIERLISKALTP